MLQKTLTTCVVKGGAGLTLLRDVADEVDGEAEHEDPDGDVNLSDGCDKVLHGDSP
jgi:hypothetical protein